MKPSASLARSITWAGSKQTYFTIRLLVDKGLVDDCYRAYAYFRWVDDVIDNSSTSREGRIAFIERQKELVNRLYRGEKPGNLTPEESMLADLISSNRNLDCGLYSFIHNFMAILAFDASRKGHSIDQQELTWYSDRLGKAVVDCIQHFIGNGHPYPQSEARYLASMAAHIAHMLRDMLPDTADGFINIPREYLEAHSISPQDVDSLPYRDWVQERVNLARKYFDAGKRYLDELDVLRCKLAGYWYCARYDGLLAAIEREEHILRADYRERRKFSAWLWMVWIGIRVTLSHLVNKGFLYLPAGSKRHSNVGESTGR